MFTANIQPTVFLTERENDSVAAERPDRSNHLVRVNLHYATSVNKQHFNLPLNYVDVVLSNMICGNGP